MAPILAAWGANARLLAKGAPPPVPAGLVDVMLIDGRTCALAAGMSLSMWHELVASGQAPKPVIQRHRFTRWRMADVKSYIADLMFNATDGEAVVAQAQRASRAAVTKRRAAQTAATAGDAA